MLPKRFQTDLVFTRVDNFHALIEAVEKWDQFMYKYKNQHKDHQDNKGTYRNRIQKFIHKLNIFQ